MIYKNRRGNQYSRNAVKYSVDKYTRDEKISIIMHVHCHKSLRVQADSTARRLERAQFLASSQTRGLLYVLHKLDLASGCKSMTRSAAAYVRDSASHREKATRGMYPVSLPVL